MRGHFADELIDMWDGKETYAREGINYSLSGEPIHVHLDWRLMPGHEQDFGWVLVAIQDITARKKAEEYLRFLGTHDVLTGLFNRAYFEEQMQKLQAYDQGPISMLLLDLNGLKFRRAAEVLRAAFGEADVVARIGGDEFAVLMVDTEADQAHAAIERVRTLIPLNNKYYQGPELSVAMGAATREPGEALEKLLGRADKAMYADKTAQRKGK
jgi:diguanylate cyclase (GGDEF)-like protein